MRHANRGLDELSLLADEPLANELARGNRLALVALYDRYGSQCFGLASYMLPFDSHRAESIVSQVFTTDRVYDPAAWSVQSWLLQLVREQCLAARRPVRVPGRAARPPTSHSNFASLTSLGKERQLERGDVRAALAQLPPATQTAIELAFFDGYTCDQIAEYLDIRLDMVRRSMRAGLQTLRSLLFPSIA